MAKEKKEDPIVIEMKTPLSKDGVDKLIDAIVKPFVIKEASIKDDFCNYTFEVTSGVGLGDSHTVKGKGIIKEDMRSAFAKLNVHLAMVDDIFKHSGIEFDDIDTMHGDELATLYNVTGFKIKGGDENESIVLIGNKFVSSAGGRIELETPRILIESSSSYKWWNELKAASDKARLEVELYKNGKYIPVEEDDEENPKKLKQTKMNFLPDISEGELADGSNAENNAPSGDDSEFQNGKV